MAISTITPPPAAAAVTLTLGVTSSQHTRALLRALGRFYELQVFATAVPSHTTAPGTRAVIATLPANAIKEEVVKMAKVSLLHVLGLEAPTVMAQEEEPRPQPTIATSRRRLQMQ